MSELQPAITRIAAIRPRERVTITGVIRSVGAEAVGSSPGFRCVVADGSGEIELIFMGYDQVSGLVPGRRCTAEGRACIHEERLVLWNPRYALEPAGAPASDASPGDEAPEGHVLIIGDDPGMCRIIEINLATRGYQVDATPVAEAAGSLLARGPDLVVLDIGLSRANGVAAIGAIRASSTAPILVISGLYGEGVDRDVIAAGASDFLVKPFPIDVLLARVAACLDAGGRR